MTGSDLTRLQEGIEDLIQKNDIKINHIFGLINKINNNNYTRYQDINYISNNYTRYPITYINNIYNNNNINNINNKKESHLDSLLVKMIFMLVKKSKDLQTELIHLKKEYDKLICCQPAAITSTRLIVDTIDETLNKCCICMDNEKEYAYVKCGHMCVCIECQQGEWLNKCPICKTTSNCIKIFK